MRTRKSKICYLFDISGELVQVLNSRKEVAELLKTSIGVINSAIFKKTCVQLKYYISNDKDFDVNTVFRKSNFNPLLSKMGRKSKIRDYFENSENYLYENE